MEELAALQAQFGAKRALSTGSYVSVGLANKSVIICYCFFILTGVEKISVCFRDCNSELNCAVAGVKVSEEGIQLWSALSP